MLVRSAASRVGRLVSHSATCSGRLLYIPSTSSETEATHQHRRVHKASTGHSGASRIGWHIFDRTSANKSSAPPPDDKSDTSDASKGVRWRIVVRYHVSNHHCHWPIITLINRLAHLWASSLPCKGSLLVACIFAHLVKISICASCLCTVQESRDLKTINKADGKIEDKKAAVFLPEHVAPAWPPMFVASHRSNEEEFSRPAAGINARIVLGSFRASAEMYLSEWRDVVQDTFGDHMDVELVELAVCDVAVRPPLGFIAIHSCTHESFQNSHGDAQLSRTDLYSIARCPSLLR